MKLQESSPEPLFQQLADAIENGILSGAFPEGSQIPSTTEFSVEFKINPATALKGVNLLVNRGILYKKRGIGVFVAENALDQLKGDRHADFYETYLTPLLKEANRLGISKEEIIAAIEKEGSL